MNKELLNRIADIIEADPNHFHMDFFIKAADKTTTNIDISTFLEYSKNQEVKCDTTACIAGWAVALTTPSHIEIDRHAIPDRAEEILDISTEIAERLFYYEDWPKNFVDSYRIANKVGKAKVAADRIRHLVETGE